jgi:A1 cistron-splicing factor AAR2
MAQSGGDTFVDIASAKKIKTLSMSSDTAFHVTPIVSPASGASKIEDVGVKGDPTFMQNQISIQRSPSTAKDHVSALSRQLSVRSNGSYDANHHAIAGVLSANTEEPSRGRERGDSNSSLIEATNTCSLSKSSSERSTKSVRSLHALGSYPLGSLRVHSPSPTRTSLDNHECLKSGDVVIIRDVPAGSLLGYDTRGFVVQKEDNFEGIKDIPPGAHFIWGGSGAASLRNGFWIMSAKRASDEYGEIHVRRWDKYTEVLDE